MKIGDLVKYKVYSDLQNNKNALGIVLSIFSGTGFAYVYWFDLKESYYEDIKMDLIKL